MQKNHAHVTYLFKTDKNNKKKRKNFNFTYLAERKVSVIPTFLKVVKISEAIIWIRLKKSLVYLHSELRKQSQVGFGGNNTYNSKL